MARIVLLAGCLAIACSGPLTYRLQMLPGPVRLIAEDRVTFTQISFYAYNKSWDFLGYDISMGATRNDSINSPSATIRCTMTTSSSLQKNHPTLIQFGGSSNTISAHCHNQSAGPLTVGSWITIRAVGSRDCALYNLDAGCDHSAPVSTQVLAYVDPPTAISVQAMAGYTQVDVTMATVPAGLTGIGLFYSPDPDEAAYRASADGSIRDGFCAITAASVTAGTPVKIQIGGTLQAGMDCLVSNFSLNTGDTIAVRNAINRTTYPWSDFQSALVP